MQKEAEAIQRIYSSFQTGKLTAIEMGQLILEAAVQSRGSVTPDLDRQRRCGYPEVIYGPGKSPDSIRSVAEAVLANSEPCELAVKRHRFAQMK
jgi:pyridinium-3,5-biscarboxylic acid mononucleotide synthase